MAKTANSQIDNVIQVQIRLITKQELYAVPDFPLSVSGSVTIKELNELINALLKESDSSHKNVEFDVLVNSEFLRVSLSEHLDERGVSVENVIDVEYLEKYPPPEPQDCLLHDDWVSAIDVREKWIVTGCYDNTINLWNTKGKHQLTVTGHTSPIKAVSWISLEDDAASFVSVSMDQTAKIWNWNITSNSVECIRTCKGHEKSVESVGMNYDKSLMATGSWDTTLKIWSTSLLDDDDEDGESTSKKIKIQHGKTRVPKRTMTGHREAVSGVIWSNKMEIITSSWDHTIKVWDSELGGIKQDIIGNKSFFDIDYSPLSKTLLTASADTFIRLYDPRSTEGALVKNKFTSHTEWVSTVSWSTTDEHLFLSGAYDSTIKLWDTRCSKAPLFNLTGHDEKVLCSNWSNPKLMVSGGADNTVRIFKARHTIR